MTNTTGIGNADPNELSRFNALASRWWDPNGDFRTLHRINPLRLDYIARRCGGLAGKRIVDVGCGGGLLSEAMAAQGAEVTGIDLAAEPLTVARLHLYESGLSVDYRECSAEQLAAETPGQYDVATCLEMLEHVPDPRSVVHACARLVRPGGEIVFSTINRNLASFLLAIVGAEYVLRLLPRGTHEYAKLIRPSELDAWARQAGLALCDLAGIRYDPFAGRAELVKRVDVNYIAHFRSPAGEDEV